MVYHRGKYYDYRDPACPEPPDECDMDEFEEDDDFDPPEEREVDDYHYGKIMDAYERRIYGD